MHDRVMRRLLHNLLYNHLKVVRLGPKGEYLHRGFIVRSKRLEWFRLFLHRFLTSDPDRELHNHPFDWSFSIILWGQYEEERFVSPGVTVKRVMGRGWRRFNRISKGDFHKVTLLTPDVYTLFFAGRKTKEWGFIDPDTGDYVTSKAYFEARGVKNTGQDTEEID